jgi:hypothetical protein
MQPASLRIKSNLFKSIKFKEFQLPAAIACPPLPTTDRNRNLLTLRIKSNLSKSIKFTKYQLPATIAYPPLPTGSLRQRTRQRSSAGHQNSEAVGRGGGGGRSSGELSELVLRQNGGSL